MIETRGEATGGWRGNVEAADGATRWFGSRPSGKGGATMPTVSREGELLLPVTYVTWAQWRRERRDSLPPTPPAATDHFCGYCWGQGRIAGPARNGEGLVPALCETCEGTGRVPAP
jgi:hypothetical protein